jgi:hypothetical protein
VGGELDHRSDQGETVDLGAGENMIPNGLVATLVLLLAFGQFVHSQTGTKNPVARRDGEHDFDFEIGVWKTHLALLQHPLTGSTKWVEYDGTSVVRKLGKHGANLVELEADGPAGHLEALSLRLYNPASHQWSLNFANRATGVMGQPTIGEFKDGRGEFFDQETLNGRAILVRFVISDITANSCHFEQAFSDDGGATWELNWITTDTRVRDQTAPSSIR